MATPAPLAPDPLPALSRRHAAGAASARGLLFTVLGEFVLPTGGSAWTSAFIEVFGRLGVEEKAIRQALARTATDGWIRPERHGRRTRWWLTPDGDRLLTEGTERIYAFTGSQPGWDGSWLLVVARVPETDRPARHVLRTRLSWAGLGSPASSVWITTHTGRQAEVERERGAETVNDVEAKKQRYVQARFVNGYMLQLVSRVSAGNVKERADLALANHVAIVRATRGGPGGLSGGILDELADFFLQRHLAK